MTIAAIQTRYAGCHFRSRLEARWAVFFDALNIAWEYEAQGYVLADGTPYLPDFHLPYLNRQLEWEPGRSPAVRDTAKQAGVHVEVKGDEAALNKPMLRSAGAQLPGGLIVLGPVPALSHSDCHDWSWPYLNDSGDWTSDLVIFGMTVRKRRLCFDFDGNRTDESHWLMPHKCFEGDDDTPRAYRAARSARFEHGHSGRS